MRSGLMLFIFLVNAVLASAAAPGFNDKTINFGTLVPLSGPSAVDGQAVFNAIKACFKRINSEGGIAGRSLEIVAFDDKYDPPQTRIGAFQLIEKDGVFGFVSNWGSQTTMAILPILEEKGIPIVGPIASANLAVPVRKTVFVVRPNGLMESEFLVSKITKELGSKRFAVIYQDDGLGKSLLQGVQQTLESQGRKIEVSGRYSRNENDVQGLINTFIEKRPEVIYLAGAMPGTAAFLRVAAPKLNAIFLGPMATTTEQFLKETRGLKFKYFGSTVVPVVSDERSPLVKSYLADMKSAGFSDINQHGLEAYLSAAVSAEAVRRLQGKLSRQAFIAALENFKSVPIYELNFSYSSTNHQGLKDPYLAKIENGAFVAAESLK